MPNAIPLLEGTDTSGGYLVSDTYGETLQNTIRRESAVLSLSRVDRVPGKRQRYAVYAGRPTAAFIGEGAAKTATGAELSEVVVNVKKIASIVLYTEELLEDAREDPTVLVSADVEAAFADLIDAHSLGFAAGAAITGSFDSELTNTTQTGELGTAGDAIAVAVSKAIEDVEANGGMANGIILASDAKAALRDARGPGDNAATPVYTDGFGREPDTMYGVPIRYSSNLDGFPAAAGKIVGLVGDFTHSVFALRKDITVRSSNQATVDVSGTPHRTWQENKTAFLWEMRVGFAAHDLNRMFSKITNAS
jgi:HK97 family phage major capsid protein